MQLNTRISPGGDFACCFLLIESGPNFLQSVCTSHLALNLHNAYYLARPLSSEPLANPHISLPPLTMTPSSLSQRPSSCDISLSCISYEGVWQGNLLAVDFLRICRESDWLEAPPPACLCCLLGARHVVADTSPFSKIAAPCVGLCMPMTPLK